MGQERKVSLYTFLFNQGYNPRVYPTTYKPSIPITCDLSRAEVSHLGEYTLLALSQWA